MQKRLQNVSRSIFTYSDVLLVQSKSLLSRLGIMQIESGNTLMPFFAVWIFFLIGFFFFLIYPHWSIDLWRDDEDSFVCFSKASYYPNIVGVGYNHNRKGHIAHHHHCLAPFLGQLKMEFISKFIQQKWYTIYSIYIALYYGWEIVTTTYIMVDVLDHKQG